MCKFQAPEAVFDRESWINAKITSFSNDASRNEKSPVPICIAEQKLIWSWFSCVPGPRKFHDHPTWVNCCPCRFVFNFDHFLTASRSSDLWTLEKGRTNCVCILPVQQRTVAQNLFDQCVAIMQQKANCDVVSALISSESHHSSFSSAALNLHLERSSPVTWTDCYKSKLIHSPWVHVVENTPKTKPYQNIEINQRSYNVLGLLSQDQIVIRFTDSVPGEE